MDRLNTFPSNNYCIYCLLIILIIYTDSPLQVLFGVLGKSLIPFIGLPLFCLLCINGKIKNDKFLKSLYKIIVYTLILSIFFIILFLFYGLPISIMGESIIVKAIKNFVLLFCYYAYIRVLISLSYNYTLKAVLKPYYWSFIILTFILLIENLQMPMALASLHNGPVPYYRIRLLTPEASTTSIILEILMVLSYYYTHIINKSIFQTITILLCSFAHFYLSSSKTFAIALILIFIIYVVNKRKDKGNEKNIILFFITIIACLGIYILINSIYQLFLYDIENYTSLATRSYTVLCGFVLGVIFPIGSGYSSYLYYFPEIMKELLNVFEKVTGEVMNTSEIVYYITADSNEGVAAKSFLSQSSMYWGIIGTFYFIKKYLGLSRSAVENNKLYQVYLFYALSLTLLVQLLFSSDIEYSVCAYISIMIYLKNRKIVQKKD